MYWNGYIEKIGSGTEDIIRRCENHGIKRPKFSQDSNFMVTIYRPETDDTDQATDQATDQVTTQVTTQVATK